MGADEISHVGKRLLIALATENPTRVLTATQVLILIGDDGEPWPESQWREFHASCDAAILSASDGTLDALGEVKAPTLPSQMRFAEQQTSPTRYKRASKRPERHTTSPPTTPPSLSSRPSY